MNSKIFTGKIKHRRYWPVGHNLSYPVYMYAFDLDEFSGLNRRYPLFGYNKFAVTSIHDRDYLQPGNLPIGEKLSELLRRHQIKHSVSNIIMITSARYFNYVFNPVSFYYCYADDHTLAAIVAEVNNTYGERHPYVLKAGTPGSGKWIARFSNTQSISRLPIQ